MSILNDVLANTTYGRPSIVSENHDINGINFVNGLSDPGELIKCGYRPELRRLHGEQDKEYAARIRPLVLALPQNEQDIILKAAIRRAGLDTSNGRVNVFVAGEAAWHGLGVQVAEAVSSQHAITLAGLDWAVEKLPLLFKHPVTGEIVGQEESFGIVRKDTAGYLGTVGSRYQPIQNAQAFEFLDKVIGEFDAKYESAGSIHGGKKIWLLVHLPKQSFAVNGQDKVEAYALFSNPHDGSGVALCVPTSQRVVCNNTLRVAISGSKGKGLSIRHTGNVKAKIAEAQSALGLAVEGFHKFRDQAEVLARTPLPNVEDYFDNVLDQVLDVTAAEALKGFNPLEAALLTAEARAKKEEAFLKACERRSNILDDILQRYESPTNGVGGTRGSAWSALNAVTEHANHAEPSRKIGSQHAQASRRFESVTVGDADRLNQIALEQALVYTRA